MESFNRKEHWENIYQTKQLNEVSWYQPTPQTSLSYFTEFNIPLDAKIIDIGGGDSFLVDHLLELGYSNVTVLDISESAIERAKVRLGDKANQVKWIQADASQFVPKEQYDVWHDRAAFHFLTEENEVSNYIKSASMGVKKGGVLIIGTFSINGPLKCSGIPIQQYNEDSMEVKFQLFFDKIECKIIDHTTPFDTVQNFIFCSFTRNEN